MKYLGAYYLHENGNLIWRNAICFEGFPGYFDSDFVKKVFYIPKTAPGNTFEEQSKWMASWLKDAYESGAHKEQIIKICEINKLPGSIIDEIIGETK